VSGDGNGSPFMLPERNQESPISRSPGKRHTIPWAYLPLRCSKACTVLNLFENR